MPLTRVARAGGAVVLACWMSLAGSSRAEGQSLTSGSLRGLVQSQAGAPIAGAHVTLETRFGAVVREFETERDGAFQLSLVSPGEYRVLVEQAGYQPIRRSGVIVVPGRLTTFVVTLEQKPPPITSVVEISEPTATVGMTQGRLIASTDLYSFDRRRDLGDVSRSISEVVAPFDGREGFAIAASGLPASMSRLMVDGVAEGFLRHPAWRDEPVRTPLFERDGLDQVQVIAVPVDGEWRGTSGTVVSAQTRRGTNQLSFRPYGSFSSAKLGGRAIDNPFDSTTSSFQVGAALSGALVPDTASFFLRFDYQQLEQPGSYPWERDAAAYGGQTVSLQQALPGIAADSFGTQIGSLVAPVVRTYKGGSGFGRVDWRIAGNTNLVARAGYASWKERGFPLGDDLVSGAGILLDARDISAALSLTSSGESGANEIRAGVNTARRDWTGPAVPATTIVANAAGFGSSSTLPAFFDRKTFDLSEAYQRQFGSHRLKGGFSATFNNYTQEYRFGSAGSFTFGDLEGFGGANGSFFQLSSPAERAQFTTTTAGVFIQDTWTVTPEIQFLAAVRYESEFLPKNKLILNTDWQGLTGIRNDSLIRDKHGFSPRLGFVWDVQNRGDWLIRGGGGIYMGAIDPALMAEAILFDRDVQVRRGLGTFATWPVAPDPSVAPNAGQRLTIINPRYRTPRTTKAEFSISRRLPGAMLHLIGSYSHADFLLRREDLNRIASAIGTTQESRPVYGALVQRGAMVLPSIGSSRRFSEFDLVSGLSSTGFVDHYELTAAIERQLVRHVAIAASYTYSKTTDNMVGSRSADPTDQLSPFPEGLNGADWTHGRSDFDVPHRGAVTVRFESGGSTPISIAGRYRVRSGLPFTPGFRPGVDVNGDLSGNNDPAFLDPNVQGIQAAYQGATCTGAINSAFAQRNSCREKMQQSLDLHLDVGVPLGSVRDRLFLQVDAFNVVSTETGLVDRALLLVDPAGTLGNDGRGHLTLPLVANPQFGTLLVRRGEPRAIRVGLRMEY